MESPSFLSVPLQKGLDIFSHPHLDPIIFLHADSVSLQRGSPRLCCKHESLSLPVRRLSCAEKGSLGREFPLERERFSPPSASWSGGLAVLGTPAEWPEEQGSDFGGHQDRGPWCPEGGALPPQVRSCVCCGSRGDLCHRGQQKFSYPKFGQDLSIWGCIHKNNSGHSNLGCPWSPDCSASFSQVQVLRVDVASPSFCYLFFYVFSSPVLLKFFVVYLVCICIDMYVPWSACGGQKTSRNPFYCVGFRINLRLLVLTEGTFISWAILLLPMFVIRHLSQSWDISKSVWVIMGEARWESGILTSERKTVLCWKSPRSITFFASDCSF